MSTVEIKEKVPVAIVGANGYTGIELVRLLAQHPGVEIRRLFSRSQAGQGFGSLYPPLQHLGLVFSPMSEDILNHRLVFFATPHGVAMAEAPALLAKGVQVIDLGADFRLKNPAIYEDYYGIPHNAQDWLQQAVYGLTEIERAALKEAQLVAVPGCYPTAVQLGFAPLLHHGVIDPSDLVASCASGVSGAGRKADTSLLFAEVSDNYRAYNASRHRHQPEIVQGLARIGGLPEAAIGLSFVPHLLPLVRGIHASLFANLNPAHTTLDAAALTRLYQDFYRDAPLIDVQPPGSHPDLRSVRHSQWLRIAVHRLGRNKVLVLVVEDNLVKGAAGQAVQCMNLMQGWPENMGLEQAAV